MPDNEFDATVDPVYVEVDTTPGEMAETVDATEQPTTTADVARVEPGSGSSTWATWAGPRVRWAHRVRKAR